MTSLDCLEPTLSSFCVILSCSGLPTDPTNHFPSILCPAQPCMSLTETLTQCPEPSATQPDLEKGSRDLQWKWEIKIQ